MLIAAVAIAALLERAWVFHRRGAHVVPMVALQVEGSHNPLQRLGFMATALDQSYFIQAGDGARIHATVGMARWTVDLDRDALDVLGETGDMSPSAIARVMENVKAKAMSMRWFGGGHMTLDASELALTAPGPIRLEDGSELMPRSWFRLVEVVDLPVPSPRLRPVA